MGLEVVFKSRGFLELDGWPELTIGEVAGRAGVATSTIRYYESIDLLPVPEREHGQRRYDETVIGKIAFIRIAQGAGFQLDEIREMVAGIDRGEGLGERMRTLSERKLDEVEALLERTQAMKGWLEVARECGCASPSECSLFPPPGEEPADPAAALELIRVHGVDCLRESG